jgi:hypothetical protein
LAVAAIAAPKAVLDPPTIFTSYGGAPGEVLYDHAYVWRIYGEFFRTDEMRSVAISRYADAFANWRDIYA